MPTSPTHQTAGDHPADEHPWQHWQPLRLGDHPDHRGPAPRPGGVDVPPLTGRRVQLRIPHPGDYPFLQGLWTNPELFYRLKHLGSTPNPLRLLDDIFAHQDVFFLATRRGSGEPLGYVSFYGTDPRYLTSRILVVGRPETHQSALMIEAAYLAMNYMFETLALRKIYGESVEFNFRALASSMRFQGLYEIEGCQKDAIFHAGRYWHLYLLTIDRERFYTLKPRLDRLMIGSDNRPVSWFADPARKDGS